MLGAKFICFRLCRGAYKLKRTFQTHCRNIVVLISKRKWARKKTVCATAILGFSLWENALQLFYKGETLNLKQISCSFVLFFLMKSWQLGNAFLMWFCTQCVSIYLIVFFSCQWVHMYTYPKKKIHYLVVVKNNCPPLPIRYLVWPSLKSIAYQCGYYKAWNSFVDFVANVCFLIWRNAYLVTD